MDQSFFQNNRRKLRETLPANSLAFIGAASVMQISNDANFPFRQDSNFWYLTGIDYSECTLVFEPSQRRELLFIPDPDEFSDLWLGGSITMEQAKQIHGFENVFYNSQMAELVQPLLAESKTVLAPDYSTYSELEAEPNSGTKRLHQQLKRYGARSIESITPLLTQLRMVKQPEELAQLDSNVRLTLDTFAKVEDALPQAKNERDLEAIFTYEFTRHGARHAYNPIIGSGANACTIHYERNNTPLERGSLVLIDAGAERNYYHADITRTMPISGTLSPQQAVIYQMVEEAQHYALNLLKPGITLKEYERDVRSYIHAQLKTHKFLPTSSTLRDTLQFFPHAASHHLGLDVHDAADLEQPLEANMVLTVEPGLYVPSDGIGVRIEDDVVITDTGCRVLG